MQLSIGTLPPTVTHNERRYVYFRPVVPGVTGQVTLVSRRDQAKDKYDTDRYEVRFSDPEHVVFLRLRVVVDDRITFRMLATEPITYSVWLRDGTRPAGCNCMAGKNNKPCKHIDIAKALLGNDGPPDFGYVPQTETVLAELPF